MYKHVLKKNPMYVYICSLCPEVLQSNLKITNLEREKDKDNSAGIC